MAEESTQRHTGEFTTPATHHRASSQDDAPSQKKQPSTAPTWLPTLERLVDLTLDFTVRGACLWGAIFGYLHTGNDLFFLLCLAVARKELGISAAIQALLGSISRIKSVNRSTARSDEQANRTENERKKA